MYENIFIKVSSYLKEFIRTIPDQDMSVHHFLPRNTKRTLDNQIGPSSLRSIGIQRRLHHASPRWPIYQSVLLTYISLHFIHVIRGILEDRFQYVACLVNNQFLVYIYILSEEYIIIWIYDFIIWITHVI